MGESGGERRERIEESEGREACGEAIGDGWFELKQQSRDGNREENGFGVREREMRRRVESSGGSDLQHCHCTEEFILHH